jgi:hypothetical protein
MSGSDRTIFSFVLDDDPRFAYQAWHLARSLMQHCGSDPAAIHVQCTPEVDERRRNLLRELGCHIHQIARFGDGRYCNKLNQLESLRAIDFDRVVLLDTDTIAVSDLRPFLSNAAIVGKTVDANRPPLATLDEIAEAAGLLNRPPICRADAIDADTYLGNCNGGFYSIPKSCCDRLSVEWRRWALWLLDNIEPLSRIGRQNHVDQVSFWLAVHQAGLPFEAASSNVNYYVHFAGEHHYFDATRPIALLHYHNVSLNVLGLLEPPAELEPLERRAVSLANDQIGEGFDNRVFWEVRYRHFPERGSGVGSRDDNLLYKRRLLREQGVEVAASVLDFGCGDLEVVKELAICRYVGIDQSSEALALARRARPDWEFRLGPEPDVQPAEMVLCLEVLIHQETEAGYRAVIAFLAENTLGSLLVSGFSADTEDIQRNPMIFFYEPLETSLFRTGRFRRIRQVGAHTSVVVYRCDV